MYEIYGEESSALASICGIEITYHKTGEKGYSVVCDDVLLYECDELNQMLNFICRRHMDIL